MMYTPGYAGDDFMNVDPYFISDKKKKEVICLSVKGLTNGAVAVLYPEVIKKTGGINGWGFICGI